MLDIVDKAFSFSKLAVALGCFLAWYVGRLAYNVYFHPLSKFPGPKLAAASRWYEGYFDLLVGQGGQYMYEIDRIHHKYGPIVRVAPNELHVKDVEYYDTLYALGVKRDKVPYMVDIFGVRDSMFGTVEHELHRSRRLVLSPYFSKRSVTRLESVIQEKVRRMCDTMSACKDRRQVIQLRDAFTANTVDITTEYSFAQCANTLDQPDFSPEWDEMIRGVTEIVTLARQFPGIVQIMQALPISVVKVLNPLAARFSQFVRLIRGHISEIFTRYSSLQEEFDVIGTEKPAYAQSIFHEILNSKAPKEEKSIDRMTQEAQSVVAAASDTTSVTLATTVFHVLSNTQIRDRLKAELKEAMEDPRSLIEWRRLEQLPYLAMKEGLRITVPVCGRLPLVSPNPLQYKEWTIPAGTYIGMSPRDALHNPTVYSSPLSFNPSRWLTNDPTEKKLMDLAFLPFNKGPRMCMGIHLAYANLYHVLSALFRRFDLELVDTIRERDVDMARDHFGMKPVKESKGIRVRVVGEADI